MELVLLGRLALATLLAGAIGWDREHRDRPAGLRTHMLVGLSAALFASISEVLIARGAGHGVQLDPTRVLQAIAASVSFLGAGTVIVNRRGGVQGLTTGASIWTAGAVGVAAGVGAYLLATGTVMLALLVLVGARHLEQQAHPQSSKDDEPSHPHAHAKTSGTQAGRAAG